jgi:hypothetical protein
MTESHISLYELTELSEIYYRLIADLPADLVIRKNFPSFSRFISPANYSHLPHSINYGVDEEHANDNWYQLSITGAQRIALLRSPHTTALFRVYIAKYLL